MFEGQSPALSELVPVKNLQRSLPNVFPTRGALDWELRVHRAEYVRAGALFEVAGRLVAHPATFERVALEIARRKAAARLGPESAAA